MVTDPYRQLLITELAAAAPVKRAIIEQELKHSREMDKRFIEIEENLLTRASLLALGVFLAGIGFAVAGLEIVASSAIIADVSATAVVMIKRSYFIPSGD